MILDQLTNAPTYFGLDSGVVIALSYLRQTDLMSLAVGRHQIDEDRVFALVSEYETKSVAESAWEAHCRHIDVQVLAAGEESVGVAPLAEMTTTEPYDVERDVLFAAGAGDFVTLTPGRFVMLFPHDAHMPGVIAARPQRVKKIVVKVRIPWS